MKYWVYLNGEIPGSYEAHELVRLADFSATTLVCPIEGNLADRNWKHAGLFPDIIENLQDRPQPGASGEERSLPLSPKDILNETSQRLFRHITGLMKELENRREEQSLILSLQRSLAETKDELSAARERIRYLQDRTALITGFEERERDLKRLLEETRSELKRVEQQREESNALLSKTRQETETAAKIVEENKHLSALTEDLTRQLADKELTLAKSLGVLRKLEIEMGRMLRSPGETPAAAPPALAPNSESDDLTGFLKKNFPQL